MANVNRYRLSLKDPFGFTIVQIHWSEAEVDEGIDVLTALLQHKSEKVWPLAALDARASYRLEIEKE